MIIISSYNPDTPRSSEDEQDLTILLGALIRWNSLSRINEFAAKDDYTKTYHKEEQKAVFRLLPKICALLNLSLIDITELIEEDHRKCLTVTSGKI